jgi:hypothetical protein
MFTTYHLDSAEELSVEIMDSIKASFKSKPITITVEVDQENIELTDEMKKTLDGRLLESEETYLSAKDLLKRLNNKYRV